MSLTILPRESVLQICDFLDIWDLGNLICTSKKFQSLGTENLTRRNLLDKFVAELKQSGVYRMGGKYGRECHLITQLCCYVETCYHEAIDDEILKEVLIKHKEISDESSL